MFETKTSLSNSVYTCKWIDRLCIFIMTIASDKAAVYHMLLNLYIGQTVVTWSPEKGDHVIEETTSHRWRRGQHWTPIASIINPEALKRSLYSYISLYWTISWSFSLTKGSYCRYYLLVNVKLWKKLPDVRYLRNRYKHFSLQNWDRWYKDQHGIKIKYKQKHK